MKNTVCIIGCGGHARSVADVILHNNPDAKLVFVDENAQPNEKLFGFDVVSECPKAEIYFVAVGDNAKRKALSQNLKLCSVVATTAHIGIGAILQDGCFIAHCAHIGPQSQIGTGTIINTHAVIEHEVSVGKFCHIAPNATICGRTTVGDNVFVGVGASIKDSVHICSNVIIGAGAVVIKDITKAGTYVGNPVRKIR